MDVVAEMWTMKKQEILQERKKKREKEIKDQTNERMINVSNQSNVEKLMKIEVKWSEVKWKK